MSELKWGELRPAEFENQLCSKHGYAIPICCLYVADGRQRSVSLKYFPAKAYEQL